ncbi:MAG TPA: hypothetical protein DCQ93_00505 [Bacteroidetes bacterium]|nr:hypothetical protein [Bacteroidota bacterium]
MFKYTPATLQKIENILKESNYTIRYEKGTFKSGFCILQEKRVVVVNKYFDIESRINSFLEMIPELDINFSLLDEKETQMLLPFLQAKLEV